MEQDKTQPVAPRSGLTHSHVDALTAIAIFFVGVVMMADNYSIGTSWGADGPQTGYFPFHIGLILSLSGVAVLLKSLFGKHRNHEVFVSWERFRLVLMVLIPTAVYVLVIQMAGIYVASVLFIGAFMRVMGKTSWLKTLTVSLCVVSLLFWMFEIQFMIPLPKGPLEALFGY